MTDTGEPTPQGSSARSAATYVYGIVDVEHPCQTDDIEGVGEPPTRLRRMDAGRVAAVVGDAPAELRAKRRDVTAHQHVLEELMKQGTILPMRFGVVARDEESLRDELVEDNEIHLAMLGALEGRIEFNVKAFCDEDELVREVATSDPTIRRLRSERATSVEDRIELGQHVAAAIETRYDDIGKQLVETLDPLAVRCVPGPSVRGAAVNVSFLVDRERTPEFVATVDRLDARLGPDVRLQRIGPLPPYSFVDMQEE
jgi:hypothetical protein